MKKYAIVASLLLLYSSLYAMDKARAGTTLQLEALLRMTQNEVQGPFIRTAPKSEYELLTEEFYDRIASKHITPDDLERYAQAGIRCTGLIPRSPHHTFTHHAIDCACDPALVRAMLAQVAQHPFRGESFYDLLVHCHDKGYQEIAVTYLTHYPYAKWGFVDEWGRETDEGFDSPLHWAARKGHTHILRILLTGLVIHAPDQEVIPINSLLNRPNYDIQTPLHVALSAQQRAASLLLLQAGASVGTMDCGSRTPFHEACAQGYEDIVGILLDRQCSINARDLEGITPLHWAAYFGHSGIVSMLLQPRPLQGAGVVPIMYLADVYAEDNEDKTPLEYALEQKHLELAKILLSEAAKKSERKGFSHMLSCAYHYGLREFVGELIRVNFAAHTWSSTLLHRATKAGEHEIVVLMLTHGADALARDHKQRTALEIAALWGDTTLVKEESIGPVTIEVLEQIGKPAAQLGVVDPTRRLAYPYEEIVKAIISYACVIPKTRYGGIQDLTKLERNPESLMLMYTCTIEKLKKILSQIHPKLKANPTIMDLLNPKLLEQNYRYAILHNLSARLGIPLPPE